MPSFFNPPIDILHVINATANTGFCETMNYENLLFMVNVLVDALDFSLDGFGHAPRHTRATRRESHRSRRTSHRNNPDKNLSAQIAFALQHILSNIFFVKTILGPFKTESFLFVDATNFLVRLLQILKKVIFVHQVEKRVEAIILHCFASVFIAEPCAVLTAVGGEGDTISSMLEAVALKILESETTREKERLLISFKNLLSLCSITCTSYDELPRRGPVDVYRRLGKKNQPYFLPFYPSVFPFVAIYDVVFFAEINTWKKKNRSILFAALCFLSSSIRFLSVFSSDTLYVADFSQQTIFKNCADLCIGRIVESLSNEFPEKEIPAQCAEELKGAAYLLKTMALTQVTTSKGKINVLCPDFVTHIASLSLEYLKEAVVPETNIGKAFEKQRVNIWKQFSSNFLILRNAPIQETFVVWDPRQRNRPLKWWIYMMDPFKRAVLMMESTENGAVLASQLRKDFFNLTSTFFFEEESKEKSNYSFLAFATTLVSIVNKKKDRTNLLNVLCNLGVLDFLLNLSVRLSRADKEPLDITYPKLLSSTANVFSPEGNDENLFVSLLNFLFGLLKEKNQLPVSFIEKIPQTLLSCTENFLKTDNQGLAIYSLFLIDSLSLPRDAKGEITEKISTSFKEIVVFISHKIELETNENIENVSGDLCTLLELMSKTFSTSAHSPFLSFPQIFRQLFNRAYVSIENPKNLIPKLKQCLRITANCSNYLGTFPSRFFDEYKKTGHVLNEKSLSALFEIGITETVEPLVNSVAISMLIQILGRFKAPQALWDQYITDILSVTYNGTVESCIFGPSIAHQVPRTKSLTLAFQNSKKLFSYPILVSAIFDMFLIQSVNVAMENQLLQLLLRCVHTSDSLEVMKLIFNKFIELNNSKEFKKRGRRVHPDNFHLLETILRIVSIPFFSRVPKYSIDVSSFSEASQAFSFLAKNKNANNVRLNKGYTCFCWVAPFLFSRVGVTPLLSYFLLSKESNPHEPTLSCGVFLSLRTLRHEEKYQSHFEFSVSTSEGIVSESVSIEEVLHALSHKRSFDSPIFSYGHINKFTPQSKFVNPLFFFISVTHKVNSFTLFVNSVPILTSSTSLLNEAEQTASRYPMKIKQAFTFPFSLFEKLEENVPIFSMFEPNVEIYNPKQDLYILERLARPLSIFHDTLEPFSGYIGPSGILSFPLKQMEMMQFYIDTEGFLKHEAYGRILVAFLPIQLSESFKHASQNLKAFNEKKMKASASSLRSRESFEHVILKVKNCIFSSSSVAEPPVYFPTNVSFVIPVDPDFSLLYLPNVVPSQPPFVGTLASSLLLGLEQYDLSVANVTKRTAVEGKPLHNNLLFIFRKLCARKKFSPMFLRIFMTVFPFLPFFDVLPESVNTPQHKYKQQPFSSFLQKSFPTLKTSEVAQVAARAQEATFLKKLDSYLFDLIFDVRSMISLYLLGFNRSTKKRHFVKDISTSLYAPLVFPFVFVPWWCHGINLSTVLWIFAQNISTSSIIPPFYSHRLLVTLFNMAKQRSRLSQAFSATFSVPLEKKPKYKILNSFDLLIERDNPFSVTSLGLQTLKTLIDAYRSLHVYQIMRQKKLFNMKPVESSPLEELMKNGLLSILSQALVRSTSPHLARVLMDYAVSLFSTTIKYNHRNEREYTGPKFIELDITEDVHIILFRMFSQAFADAAQTSHLAFFRLVGILEKCSFFKIFPLLLYQSLAIRECQMEAATLINMLTEFFKNFLLSLSQAISCDFPGELPSIEYYLSEMMPLPPPSRRKTHSMHDLFEVLLPVFFSPLHSTRRDGAKCIAPPLLRSLLRSFKLLCKFMDESTIEAPSLEMNFGQLGIGAFPALILRLLPHASFEITDGFISNFRNSFMKCFGLSNWLGLALKHNRMPGVREDPASEHKRLAKKFSQQSERPKTSSTARKKMKKLFYIGDRSAPMSRRDVREIISAAIACAELQTVPDSATPQEKHLLYSQAHIQLLVETAAQQERERQKTLVPSIAASVSCKLIAEVLFAEMCLTPKASLATPPFARELLAQSQQSYYFTTCVLDSLLDFATQTFEQFPGTREFCVRNFTHSLCSMFLKQVDRSCFFCPDLKGLFGPLPYRILRFAEKLAQLATLLNVKRLNRVIAVLFVCLVASPQESAVSAHTFSFLETLWENNFPVDAFCQEGGIPFLLTLACIPGPMGARPPPAAARFLAQVAAGTDQSKYTLEGLIGNKHVYGLLAPRITGNRPEAAADSFLDHIHDARGRVVCGSIRQRCVKSVSKARRHDYLLEPSRLEYAFKAEHRRVLPTFFELSGLQLVSSFDHATPSSVPLIKASLGKAFADLLFFVPSIPLCPP
eukprot:gnl/Chilomastix_cuspidata/5395.p1 GENE.gnl/Chilomastix_cuspidata/5395~~gnl/Chilomastix_cuspidata/5395.p1  ORF type:complete len:2428 (+),score=414.64 gnl/Chilomastix_cuspidata/5395:333-7286(+)